MMRSGRVSETVEDADDEDMVAGLPHKKSRVGPSTPQGLRWSGAHNTACHHRRARERVPVKVRAARYGLTGTRVGEASHLGPRRRQVIPSTDDDLDSTFLDEFELGLNAPTDSRRSSGAHVPLSPCGWPPAPEAFVVSVVEHLKTPAPSVCVPTNVSTVPAASGELREARRAFLPDSGGPTSIDMCTSPEHESHQLRGNRFAVLSREEDFPHGQAGQGVPRRRLVLTNMESGVVRPSVHTLQHGVCYGVHG